MYIKRGRGVMRWCFSRIIYYKSGTEGVYIKRGRGALRTIALHAHLWDVRILIAALRAHTIDRSPSILIATAHLWDRLCATFDLTVHLLMDVYRYGTFKWCVYCEYYNRKRPRHGPSQLCTYCKYVVSEQTLLFRPLFWSILIYFQIRLCFFYAVFYRKNI